MRMVAECLLWFGCIASFGVARGVAAEDSSSSTPAVSLSSAKHDYDAVKALDVPLEQSKLLLPPDQIPVLQSKSSAPPTLSLLERRQLEDITPPTKAPRKNWLLDAMEAKPADGKKALRTSDFGFTGEGGEESTATNLGAPRIARVEVDRSKSSLKSAAKSEVTTGANPLAAYLSGWLSPGDLALLKSTADTSPQPSRNDRIDIGEAPAQFKVPTTFVAPMETLGGPSGASSSPNPYLSDLVGPAVSSFAPVSVAAAGLKSVEVKTIEEAAHLTQAPEQYSPATPPSHDFLKPDEDAKYFKQLKRF